MPLFHNQLSNMYYIAYKAFPFYQFSSGAHKQIFLLVDSHLFQEAVRPWESDVKSVADRPRAPAEVPG